MNKKILYCVAFFLIFIPLCYILLCSELNYSFEFHYITNDNGEQQSLLLSLIMYAMIFGLIYVHIFAWGVMILMPLEAILFKIQSESIKSIPSENLESAITFFGITSAIVLFILFFLHITDIATINFC